MSFARLQKKIDAMRNPTVVGLDPDLRHIPPELLDKHIAELGETLEAASRAVLEFNLNLIEGLCGIVPAVKPQSAYYEALGPQGVVTLKLTCDFAKSKGMYVIVDGKRGDIGSTAQAYSAAYLGAVKVGNAEHMPFDADALTVNAYLGSDGIRPFLETSEKFDKAFFALVKTSNPSAGELQDRMLEQFTIDNSQLTIDEGMKFAAHGKECPSRTEVRLWNRSLACETVPLDTLYMAVGDLIEEISRETIDEYGYTRAGAVVGATYPKELEFLRKRLKHTFFLVPGYGAQGGTAANVAFAFDEKGRGAIVNASRSIIAAWKEGNARFTGVGHYVDAAQNAALEMRDELRAAMV